MPLENLPDLQRKAFVKVYPGYGHTGDLVIYGHVLTRELRLSGTKSNTIVGNFLRLLRLFRARPVPFAPVVLQFGDQVIQGRCEHDGFFRFEWSSDKQLAAGWYEVQVQCLSGGGSVLASATGQVWVPHITQLAFISDIDDTIMKSYSATVFRRLYELLRRNPEKRRLFAETANHYSMLASAHTTDDTPNPFFYVSSSEWNLHEYLLRIFRHQRLPQGIFLLNQLKSWFQLIKTGKTGHSGKLMRISRILQVFPRQRFVLLGDNSQEDPDIYKAIAEKHPEQIYAVYIRNVRHTRSESTAALLAALEQGTGIAVCLFEKSDEAVAHGRKIGLL